MPRSEEANQRIREAQRDKILEAARKVFAQKGRAATMADVAAEAQISQGLAYRYFASKEVLFQTLVEQMMQPGDGFTPGIFQIPGTAGERLDFLITRILDSRRQQPEFFQLFYQLLADDTLPAHLREMIHQQAQQFQMVMRRLIVEGQATGEVAPDDPDQLVAAVMACISGLWQGMALSDPDEVRKNFPDAKIVLRMLKPSPPG